jgi:chemotaxis protein MotB
MMAALLLLFVLIISCTMLQAKKQYEDRTKELETQSIELKRKQELIGEQQEIMQKQQEQLDKIIGVKSGLIETLKEEFDGTDLKVSVDPQTGAITFDSSILFDVNKYALKASGEEFLEKFLPLYLNVLLKPEYSDYISEIIIEGHTDTNGTYMHNLELSQERALSVATFCLKDENTILSLEEKEKLRGMMTANGKSYSNPIYNADGTVNMDASRRVEFKFRLKDEDMVNEILNILSE